METKAKIKAFLILASVLIGICTMQCNTQKSEPLPSFNILLLDNSTILNTSQIPEGRAFVLMYFSPDCDHCQRETKDLLNNMEKAKDTKFYFITTARFDELKDFAKEYKLTNYSNIVAGRDYQLFILRNFQATPPYLVIYDKNKIKKAVFEGEHKAEKIIEVIHKIEG